MEAIINKIGLSFENRSPLAKTVVVLKNPDQSIRWIIPVKAKKAYFLQFYSVSTFKSQVLAWGLQLIFSLGLARFVFETREIYVLNENSNQSLDFSSNEWAIFTGTEGPNRKIIISFPEKNTIAKIALNSKSRLLLDNECRTLNRLAELGIASFDYAKGIVKEGILFQNNLSEYSKRSGVFSKVHKEALNEMYNKTRTEIDLYDLPMYKKTLERLNILQTKATSNFFPQGIIRKLKAISKSIENQRITVALSHGDFTPWNMYSQGRKLAIYDWELSCYQSPIGYDAFHFILQNGILVERLNYETIDKKIKATITQKDMNNWANKEVDYSLYLKLYLLNSISYYALLYFEQAKWHQQIYWQLEVWSQALNPFLEEKYTQRSLLIIDIFDFLFSKKYGTLKFDSILPERLGENSDIDVLLNKKSFKDVCHFLKNHHLSAVVKSNKKSFKGEIQIFTKDQGFLSLDIMWALKRKYLYFLNVNDILKRVSINHSGVKVVSPIDTARYVAYFYSLNREAVPAKYQSYSKLLEQSTLPEDSILCEAFTTPKPNFQQIETWVNENKSNKNIEFVISFINYCVDTLKEVFSQKGIIITFSGVDGAGKSTIIAETKKIIEKKLRKKVVIIRHRPSLLPILSALTLGKENAEKKAASTLPRQGQNRSLISSLLRFGYYYTDYLLGQFYVYIKHTFRGEVVLYDRYYFDFINDGLRSNIRLPKWLTKAGYTLLFSPHLNFFLYADAQTILSRKKELDEKDITHLTQEYLTLFSELDARHANSYFSVENLKIENTLKFIANRTQAKMI